MNLTLISRIIHNHMKGLPMNNDGTPKIDSNATAQLMGALLRGFFFGDEAAVIDFTQAPNQPAAQPQASPKASPQAQAPNQPAAQPQASPKASPQAQAQEPPKGVMVAAETFKVISELKPNMFPQEPRLDLIQQAFDCFNHIGLSFTDTCLLLATIRATMIRTQGVPPEATDYTADVALQVVDVLASEQESA